jgi:hypothetical protein
MSPTDAATLPLADGATADAATPTNAGKAPAVKKATAKKPVAKKPVAAKKAVAPKKPVAAKKPAAAKKPVAAKPVAKAKATVAAKPAAAKKATAKVAKAAKTKVAAKEIVKEISLPKDKQKKHKLVRDSFSMPEAEYAVLGNVKKACLKAGVEVKKSELLRIGVALIQKMDVAALKSVLATLPPLKAGRPKQVK